MVVDIKMMVVKGGGVCPKQEQFGMETKHSCKQQPYRLPLCVLIAMLLAPVFSLLIFYLYAASWLVGWWVCGVLTGLTHIYSLFSRKVKLWLREPRDPEY